MRTAPLPTPLQTILHDPSPLADSCLGVLRSRAPAPDEEPVAWAEGRGAAFPQEHAGVDRGGAARDRA